MGKWRKGAGGGREEEKRTNTEGGDGESIVTITASSEHRASPQTCLPVQIVLWQL